MMSLLLAFKKKEKKKKLLLTNLTSMTLKETDCVCPKCYPHYTCWNQHYFPLQCLIYNKQHFKNKFIHIHFSKIFLFKNNLLPFVRYDLIIFFLLELQIFLFVKLFINRGKKWYKKCLVNNMCVYLSAIQFLQEHLQGVK